MSRLTQGSCGCWLKLFYSKLRNDKQTTKPAENRSKEPIIWSDISLRVKNRNKPVLGEGGSSHDRHCWLEVVEGSEKDQTSWNWRGAHAHFDFTSLRCLHIHRCWKFSCTVPAHFLTGASHKFKAPVCRISELNLTNHSWEVSIRALFSSPLPFYGARVPLPPYVGTALVARSDGKHTNRPSCFIFWRFIPKMTRVFTSFSQKAAGWCSHTCRPNI